jgi:ABC-2 type transport system permease protein
MNPVILMVLINKVFAFVKRDFQNDISYKLSFLLQVFGIFINVSVFFFLSKLLGAAQIPQLSQYGGNYFAFVLIGIAFNYYLNVALYSITQSIREGQMTGTLEALLVTQTEIPTIIISSSIYSFLFATLRVIIFLIIGVLIYGLDLTRANYLGALIILIISIISFSSFGILSASFVMVLKRGDPVAGIFNGISWLLGGVYYPIAILPVWLRAFSYFIPVTYSLEGMRLALLKGASCYQLLPNILSLLAFTAVLMPISIYAFQFAIRLAKRDGSLTHY